VIDGKDGRSGKLRKNTFSR